jgi:hypothetical protein
MPNFTEFGFHNPNFGGINNYDGQQVLRPIGTHYPVQTGPAYYGGSNFNMSGSASLTHNGNGFSNSATPKQYDPNRYLGGNQFNM